MALTCTVVKNKSPEKTPVLITVDVKKIYI